MDPELHSVTKFFYDQGWCGINIEPNKWFFDKLISERPRDINLNVALGDHDEARRFHVFKEYGLSTFDQASRDRFVELGFIAEETTVPVTTLASVCHKYVDRPIDFLKVDCEGWEKLTLAGADWEHFRPTVIVVEATLPLTDIASHTEWEPILVENAQYDMVYFDGLNRFYLRRDSPGLRTHFGTPPNVFDEFKVHATELAEQASQLLQRERDEFAARESEIRRETAAWKAVAEANQKELEVGVSQIAQMEKERRDLGQSLLKARLWIGRLSQDLVASKLREQR
jgi:FkbM family methyltransferase